MLAIQDDQQGSNQFILNFARDCSKQSQKKNFKAATPTRLTNRTNTTIKTKGFSEIVKTPNRESLLAMFGTPSKSMIPRIIPQNLD